MGLYSLTIYEGALGLPLFTNFNLPGHVGVSYVSLNCLCGIQICGYGCKEWTICSILGQGLV